MKNNKPRRVACYMRVETKVQVDHHIDEESTPATREELLEEVAVEEDADEYFVQQTMEIAY